MQVESSKIHEKCTHQKQIVIFVKHFMIHLMSVITQHETKYEYDYYLNPFISQNKNFND